MHIKSKARLAVHTKGYSPIGWVLVVLHWGNHRRTAILAAFAGKGGRERCRTGSSSTPDTVPLGFFPGSVLLATEAK
ncbi:hypothetical protein L2E82_47302 [Cichorium intybus]|uniref:Uncharacterized protein n=1 Tax=Cichorium intybus TaxID=13427 RepID=A0ACB8YVN3_CICIN|nr:hypothetical protein L2E82_47302 [Cichorium intybus]